MSDVKLHLGDCLAVMATLPENSIDSIVTDPPYGLSDGPTKYLGDGGRGGFMGKDWDHGVPGVAFWQAALRVAKPGAMLLAFGGTRTHHRLMVAIEDAGWEIRDCLMFLYGSGFPKSLSISKAIDRAAGAEREVIGISRNSRFNQNKMYANGNGLRGHESYEGDPVSAPATEAARQWDGWGSSLKPAFEPIILAMKKLDKNFANNALAHGVAGLWVDGTRIDTDELTPRNNRVGQNGWKNSSGGYVEPSPNGRWPANLLLTPESAALLDAQSGERGNSARPQSKGRVYDKDNAQVYGKYAPTGHNSLHNDTGGASCYFQHIQPDGEDEMRFFYAAKSSRRERNAGLEGMEEQPGGALKSGDGGWRNEEARGRQPRHDQQHMAQNFHPCVKPISLCRFLARLTKTPTGGTVLDPFMGSGSIGIGAILEGRDFVGIEIDADYLAIAEKRIAYWQAKAQAQLSLELESA